MWYERYDFEENPFKNEERELISFNVIIDEVLYRINSGSLVFIGGKEGSGKTAILKKAIEKFRGEGKVAYVDCKKVDDPNIEKVILKKYGLFNRLFHSKPSGMILLMDDIQELGKKNNERIKYFFDQNYIKSAVFTGNDLEETQFSDSLKDRISKIIKIKELSEDDAVEIIDNIFQGKEIIPEEMIKKIYRLSNKNIKIFLENCEKLCELSGEKITEDDFNKVFGEVKEDTSKKSKKKKADVFVDGKEEIPKPVEENVKEEDIAERFY